jgi:carbonic anhydrase
MGGMSIVASLLRKNARFAERFRLAGLPAAPASGVAILTCMDARLDVLRMLGLQLGDAHVVRNAGARASEDAIRSLVASATLGDTREILVIHHTRCAMRSVTNEELQERVTELTGADATGVEFTPPLTDLRESVWEDVRRIATARFIPAEVSVSGLIYDVDTGKLELVVDPSRARVG